MRFADADRHAIHELNSTILQASTFIRDQKRGLPRQAVRALQRQEERGLLRQAVRPLHRQEERARGYWDRKNASVGNKKREIQFIHCNF